MIYYGNEKVERILFHIEDDVDDMHWIYLVRSCDDNVFYVRACCDKDWEWTFYDNSTNYEMIKHSIMDIMFDCDDMEEVMDELDDLFEDCFSEIAVYE